MKYYTELRYRLMPYIYSLAGMTYFNDYTIMRALVMDYADDKNTYNIDDQFMFDPAFMACPVHQYKKRDREVYFLPEPGMTIIRARALPEELPAQCLRLMNKCHCLCVAVLSFQLES